MTAQQPVALVTGASSGIGKEVALRLVEAGFQVVGTSRDASALTGGEGLTFVDLDVSSDVSVAAAVEHVLGRFGRLDVLVNNAGSFDSAMVRPDVLLPAYEQQGKTFAKVMADSTNDGDDPATVAKVIFTAATDTKPRLRYTAGVTAGRVSALRRYVPARTFDKQIRKINRFAG